MQFFYVDNDPDDLAIFLYVAKEVEISLKLFNSGEQVLAALRENEPPFAILLDVNMPGMDGFDVIRRITGDSSNVPVIAYSTSNDDYAIGKAREAGATLFLQKPNTITGLKHALQTVSRISWEKFDQKKNFFCNFSV